MRGPTSWGDGECCPGGGRCLKSGTHAMHCHCLGAVGNAFPAMHCLSASRQWAVQLLHCSASPTRGSGQWNSCQALPHCPGAVGSATPAMPCLTCYALPYCQGAVRSGTPAMHCLTAGGSGQCTSCSTLSHRPGAVGSATHATYCHTAWGQWAVELLQCTGPPAGGTRKTAQEAVAALRAELMQCTATLLACSG